MMPPPKAGAIKTSVWEISSLREAGSTPSLDFFRRLPPLIIPLGGLLDRPLLDLLQGLDVPGEYFQDLRERNLAPETPLTVNEPGEGEGITLFLEIQIRCQDLCPGRRGPPPRPGLEQGLPRPPPPANFFFGPL